MKNLFVRSTACGLLFIPAVLAFAAVLPATEPISASWQQHDMTFNYFGFTSHFTCSGLEGQVKSILKYLGARKDAKVSADGCPRGPDSVGRAQWVKVSFFTLRPSGAGEPSTVKAQWVARSLTSRRPFFMGDGDCELIEQMKGLIANNFALRDLSYRTDCTPHELNLDGFSVAAHVLLPLPGADRRLADNR